MDISITIITLNEEKNLGRCLEGIKGLSDDVIVIDSGSTDRTEEIAAQHEVTFHTIEWSSYGAARNKGAELARHNLILALDADEVPDAVLMASILRIKASPESDADIYTFNRLTNYCGHWIKHSGWYPDVKSRIYLKDKAEWNDVPVHEKLEYSSDAEVKHLEGDLLHYSYYSEEEHRERADKYSRLTAIKMHSRGKKAGPLRPFLSMLVRFIGMYIINLGFLDGKAGWQIARISAASNFYKYQSLRKLNRGENV